MRLPDDDDKKITPQMLGAVIGAAAFLLVVLVVVLLANRSAESTRKQGASSTGNVISSGGSESGNSPILAENTEKPTVQSPQDLDFWELYPENTESPEEETTPAPSETPVPEDPSTDGKHTLVQYRDGTEEWVLISQYLPKQNYDSTNLVCKSDYMYYYTDGRQTSFVGVDISKYQDYVDFVKVKKSGIDFVMIRTGVRGYGTGQITMDDYYYENIKRATDAGLQVGVYFNSQAITVEEAQEEAALVIEAVGDYRIDYPICFSMGFVDNDVARIETLSKTEKTDIALAFLNSIKEAGYTGMLEGDKEWLIKEVDMSKLTAFDVWLSQPGDLPDYPYNFTIWRYKTDGKVDGIQGNVSLNISFIDYAEK